MNYEEQLKRFTSSGQRVIAMAYKQFKLSTTEPSQDPLTNCERYQYNLINKSVECWLSFSGNQKCTRTLKSRELMESDLCFLGLFIFENRLKPESSKVISRLQNARIRNLMITGMF